MLADQSIFWAGTCDRQNSQLGSKLALSLCQLPGMPHMSRVLCNVCTAELQVQSGVMVVHAP